MNLKERIRDIPDFPKQGIIFKDITTLLKDKDAFHETIHMLAEQYRGTPVDQIIAIESRGFIFGAALAYRLQTGFIPVRKPGKLPHQIEKEIYELEYGKDSLEIHVDAFEKGQRILIVDDLLATGGTAAAVGRLVEKLSGKVVGFSFVIELTFLNGRDKLEGYEVKSLLQY
jgi:adenine phosphoribosyltransferase